MQITKNFNQNLKKVYLKTRLFFKRFLWKLYLQTKRPLILFKIKEINPD